MVHFSAPNTLATLTVLMTSHREWCTLVHRIPEIDIRTLNDNTAVNGAL